jgi:hypothetical protein
MWWIVVICSSQLGKDIHIFNIVNHRPSRGSGPVETEPDSISELR